MRKQAERKSITYLARSREAKLSSCASLRISSSFCLIGVSIAISSKIRAEKIK